MKKTISGVIFMCKILSCCNKMFHDHFDIKLVRKYKFFLFRKSEFQILLELCETLAEIDLLPELRRVGSLWSNTNSTISSNMATAIESNQMDELKNESFWQDMIFKGASKDDLWRQIAQDVLDRCDINNEGKTWHAVIMCKTLCDEFKICTFFFQCYVNELTLFGKT